MKGLNTQSQKEGRLLWETNRRAGGACTVFSLLLGKPIVILSDIFFGTQPSNRQHGCWRRRFQPWMAGETPVTDVAANLGNRKKYHLVSLGEAELQ